LNPPTSLLPIHHRQIFLLMSLLPNTMKYTTIILTSITALSLSACKNPADKTTDAAVADAKEVATATGGTVYNFSASSTIEFIGSKVTGSQSGSFEKFTGSFTLVDGEPKAGSFTIDMDSTTTAKAKLTSHLKNEDFFDVPNHPETKFEVTSFKKNSATSYDLVGNLTLRGKTNNITFPTQVTQDGKAVTIQAEFDINRQDFGIAYAGKKVFRQSYN